jgi:hypothetical protein
MKATYIEYSETNSFSKTLLAYLAHDEALKSFWETGLPGLVLKSN